MKRILLTFLVLAFAMLSCKKDDKDPVGKGDLNVIVTINGYQLSAGAEIYTNPASKQGVTDEFGSVLLTGLDAGSYEVYANLENVGSGKSVVKVKADELAEIRINIIAGIYVGLAPTIDIILPGVPAEFTQGETITFSAVIEDDKTPHAEIDVKWESNLDGILNSDSPDENGNVSFSTASLSRGLHKITLTATDSEDYTSTATVNVSTLAPGAVTLLQPVKNEGTVILTWTEYQQSDFLKYEVYRSQSNYSGENFELISTLTDKNQTTFTDLTPPLEFQVSYYIRVTNTDENSRNSNIEVVDSPSGYIFNFQASDMLKHPTQPYIYLVNQGGQKLIKFDYINMQVVTETTLQGNIGYCDIGDNGFGVEIYAPSNDGWIYVYSADDLRQTTSISTGLSTKSVVINGLGHVIASVMPSPWWEQPVRTYMRSTGINIDGNGDFDGDRLRMIPGKNEIISISTSVSPTDMEYFKLTDNGMFEMHQDDPYHGDYPLNANIFRISPSGEYSITSNSGAVYYANSSMEYKGQLQHGTLKFSDFAFNDDGSVIYAATSNRKSIQIGYYPSLIRDNEILTRGFPVFILRDGNKIISLSKSNENAVNTGIEIINLP